MEKVVGVRDLKNKLSHYLREVKRGRSVVVAERGKIVATIVPAHQPRGVEKLKELASRGLGTWKGGKPKGSSRRVLVTGKPVGEIVLEDRR